jgi:hypothetical protein
LLLIALLLIALLVIALLIAHSIYSSIAMLTNILNLLLFINIIMIQSRSILSGSFDTSSVDVKKESNQSGVPVVENSCTHNKGTSLSTTGHTTVTCSSTLSLPNYESNHDDTDVKETKSTVGNSNDEKIMSTNNNKNNIITYRETKEGRKYPKEEEDKGYIQIVNALSNDEKLKMSDGNLPMRHYRADKGDITKAIQRTKYAIQWREKFGVEKMLQAVHGDHYTSRRDHDVNIHNGHDINEEEMKELRDIILKENETGKIYARGYDKHGHAILYFYLTRENTNHNENNIKHLVYHIERAIAASAKNNCEKIIIIMDFTNWTMKHSAPMSVTKETIHILQDCYVERLLRVYMTNAPVLFRTFWSMVKPFIDPVTKQKIVFCAGKKSAAVMEEELDMSVLEKSAFGTEDIKPYDSKEYFSLPIDTVFDETQTFE